MGISSAFRELREDKDFFDVTLACDNEQLLAHKVILSACSPFFRAVLKRNKHEHPLLYLKGVKYTDLLAVLNFMYQGEVNVAQEELNTFLSVAEDLKVKGLTQTNEKSCSEPKSSQRELPLRHENEPLKSKVHTINPVHRRTPKSLNQLPTPENDEVQEVSLIKSEPVPVHLEESKSHLPTQTYPTTDQQPYATNMASNTTVSVTDQNADMSIYGEEYAADYGTYDDFIDTTYDNGIVTEAPTVEGNQVEELYGQVFIGSAEAFQCSLCQYRSSERKNIRRHVKYQHMNVSDNVPCHDCGKIFKRRNAYKLHRKTVHADMFEYQ